MDDIEKKRKRLKFVIEDVITKDIEKQEPCLVQFSNGTLKDSEEVCAKLYRNNSQLFPRRRKERILRIEGTRLPYMGKNFGPDVHNPFKEKMFVGVLDKKTKKMILYEASNFLVHPTLDNRNVLLSEGTKDETQEGKSAVFKDFGGRRGRAVARKYEEKAVRIDQMTDALEEAIVDVTPIPEEEMTQSDKVNPILPPCDTEAQDASGVYKLSDIVSDNELSYLNVEAMTFLEMEKISEEIQSTKSVLFWVLLASSKFITSESDQAKAVCVALYIEYLIALHKTQFRSTPKLDKCPKPVKLGIVRNFTDGKLRKPTSSESDKLAAHVIILTLIQTNFEAPFSALCQALKIQKQRLVALVETVGGHYNSQKEVVTLKLPFNSRSGVGTTKLKRRKRFKK